MGGMRAVSRAISYCLIFLAGIVCKPPALADTQSAVCSLPDDELLSRFVAAAGWLDRPDNATLPQFMRWSERRALIGFYMDRSARRPSDPWARFYERVNGIGLLGLFGRFELAIQGGQSANSRIIDNPSIDIKVVTASREMKQQVFQRLPRSIPTSPETDRCRVFLSLAGPRGRITFISRSEVVVDDDLEGSDLTTCIAYALVRSLGLFRWGSDGRDRPPADKYTEVPIFVETLYRIPDTVDEATLREQLLLAKSSVCR